VKDYFCVFPAFVGGFYVLVGMVSDNNTFLLRGIALIVMGIAGKVFFNDK
jgi:hypothetical protein